MRKLHDISEVCNMLGTTSRALRFYEAEGLIQSTTEPPSLRRKYTDEQISDIKNILALRALGLPIKAIKDLTREKTTLREAVILHRAQLIRLIGEKQAQINLLEEVLHGIDASNENILGLTSDVVCTDSQLKIAEECTDALLCKKYNFIIEHFSDDLKILLSEDALAHSFKMTISPLGDFVHKEILSRSEQSPNIVICSVKYEKMILRLKYVFHGDLIYGFWTDYAE